MLRIQINSEMYKKYYLKESGGFTNVFFEENCLELITKYQDIL